MHPVAGWALEQTPPFSCESGCGPPSVTMTSTQSPAETSGPIHVLAGLGTQTLFEGFRHPRARVYLADKGQASPADVVPDLVVVRCETAQLLNLTDPGVSDRAWAAIAAGGAGVVFDASAEGRFHTPQRTEVLHGFLEARGISPTRAVYLTQDRRYGEDYLAHRVATGGGPAMSVVPHDLWIWRFASQFVGVGEIVLDERLQQFRVRQARRPRRFVSLNFTPRPTKALFLLSLMRDGLWDQGYISFGGFDQHARDSGEDLVGFRRFMRRLAGFEDLAVELTPLLAELDAYGQVMFGKVRREEGDPRFVRGSPFRDPRMTEFDSSWFSVITETEMRDWPSRITEKPLKSLVNFHPLLTFGNPGSLRMLRELGFATFEDVIDQSYDDELDPRRRFDMVYAEVARLCAMDETQLARLEAAIADKLEANARWGLIDLPKTRRRQNDAALIDQILAAVGLG